MNFAVHSTHFFGLCDLYTSVYNLSILSWLCHSKFKSSKSCVFHIILFFISIQRCLHQLTSSISFTASDTKAWFCSQITCTTWQLSEKMIYKALFSINIVGFGQFSVSRLLFIFSYFLTLQKISEFLDSQKFCSISGFGWSVSQPWLRPWTKTWSKAASKEKGIICCIQQRHQG